MTEMPNRLTLIAMAGAMETLHSMRIESPKDRYTPDDAAGLCSIAPMTVLFFGGAAPETMQYVHPNFTTHLSDADIARIADAVRPAPGFTGGEVFGKLPATGPFPLNYGGAGGPGKIEVTLPLDGGLPE